MPFQGKVLLVDDEPHIRKFLSLILRQLGITNIVEASNGQEAIKMYAEEQPSLVLLDVNMPVLDGIGALREIRQIDPDAVVIMLTSVTGRVIVEQAAEMGASNYIRKDTPKDELLQSLKETLETCFETE